MTKPNSSHYEGDLIKPPNVDPMSLVRVPLTEDDSKRIRRKTDRVILLVLIWVYFLQILDKTVLGYGATFGMKKDTNLTGNQYSLVGSAAPIAQLAWQPFSSFLIIKVPHRILMPVLCLGWGIAQAAMAACHNFGGLMAARFFLGLFEAGCLPLFSIITSQWYRRAEQPLRIAAWYSTNGAATVIAAALSYGLGHIKSHLLLPWQIIFLFVGLITVITAPFIYWKLDNDIPSARFLTEEEKPQAMERLRANQTGTGNREFRMNHVVEAGLEPKTYLWIGMAMLLNIGASVTNVFGPLILSGLGFDTYTTTLLNMPFGALQFIVILIASYLAQKARIKAAVLAAFMLPVVAGLAVLYVMPRNDSVHGPLLTGYYLLAFLFGGNPLIVTWIVGNTAGTTKKSIVMSLFNAATSAGNIVGPLLFTEKDAPAYHPGLRACLGIFVALVAIVLIQWANLIVLNKMQEKRRVQNGKPAKMVDRSMADQYEEMEDEEGGEQQVGDQAFMDLTDRENDDYHSTVNSNCLDIRYNIRESLSYVANNTTPLDSSPSVNSNGPDDMFIQHESEPLYFRYNLTTGQTLYILLNPRSELRRQLKSLTARLPPSTLHPFALHTAILFHTLSSCRTQIDNIVKWLLWIETQLHQGSLFEIADADRFSRYIQLLHKMSRSLITLEHSTQRDESNINHLLRDHERIWDLSQKHTDSVTLDASMHDRIGDDLRCLRGFCEDRQRHILNLRQRTHSFITLLYNLITGHDSTVNLRIAAQSANIARESRRDSVSMKIIAAVTLLYLPATFIDLRAIGWRYPLSTEY
ncbi:hypothetical protein MW887_003380 [Aspergillus wentii]|nr:hypothetical protein MW887_003380 [Aspergillus wentii]